MPKLDFNPQLNKKQLMTINSPATEILYGGAAGGGKLLFLKEKIPVPLSTSITGFKEHGNLKVGDEVYSPSGKPVKVLKRHPTEENPDAYELEFRTGEVIKADAGHLWLSWSNAERERLHKSSEEYRRKRRESRPSRALENPERPTSQENITKSNQEREYDIKPASPSIRTTKEMFETQRIQKSHRVNYSIEVINPIQGDDVDLPIDPYLYGLWLGDGYSGAPNIVMMESDWKEIESFVENPTSIRTQSEECSKLQTLHIRRFESLKKIKWHKHIPIEYLRASYSQRLELLCGMMDTDGTCGKNNNKCEISFSNKELIENTHHLLSSLGIKCAIHEKKLDKKYKRHYRVSFRTNEAVFKLPRKLERQQDVKRETCNRRYITEIRKCDPVPMNCITVEGGLYCVGESFITTHNSYLMRAAAITYAVEIPGLQIYLFRRIREDLVKNHMEGPGGFRALLADWANKKFVQIVEDEIRFLNGSRIYLCHCKDEKDMYKYDGAEMHLLLMDELTHFTESIYRYLRIRVRMIGMLDKVPAKYKKMFPRIICGSNPGKLGHIWVKRTFLEFQEPMAVSQAPDDDGGMYRQFIPAILEDNPFMAKEDPDYEKRLMGLGNPQLIEAMRYGNWDISAGAALEKLSRVLEDGHMIRPFEPPSHWVKFTSMDWGSFRPFSAGWYTVASENVELVGKDGYPTRYIPKNSLIRYREWYGWNGTPNEGCGLEATEVANRKLDIEEDAGEVMDYRVCDLDMFAKRDGPSSMEKIFESTDGKYVADRAKKGPGSRGRNYQEVRERINGEDGMPMLYITADCKHFWRTCPDLQRDEVRPDDGPDESQELHCYDEVAYACASRPYAKTKRNRYDDDIKKVKRKIGPKRTKKVNAKGGYGKARKSS